MSKKRIRNWIIKRLGGYTFEELNPVFKYEKNQIINIEGSVSIQHELNSNEKEANEYLEREICHRIANKIYDERCYRTTEIGYDAIGNYDLLQYQIRVVKEDCYETQTEENK